MGVAAAVPLLVVVADGVRPGAEPGHQRFDEVRALFRVALERRPLLVVGTIGLVEDGAGYGQLADVVQQRPPAELVPLLVGEPGFLGQQIGQRADPFGVTPGPPVVGSEGGHQNQCRLGGFTGVAAETVLPEPVERLAPRPPAGGPPGGHHPGRGLVGEGHREGEQPGQRQEPPGEALDHQDDGHRHRHQRQEPADRGPELRRLFPDPGYLPRRQRPRHRRHHHDEDADQPGYERPGDPAAATLCRHGNQARTQTVAGRSTSGAFVPFRVTRAGRSAGPSATRTAPPPGR